MENITELLDSRVAELIRRYEKLSEKAMILESENRKLKDKIESDRLKLKKVLDTLDNLGL